MADLKTTYKDDVLNTSANEKRKYNMITNEDGTVSLVDATDYLQVGDSFGAADINATNKKVNELDSNLTFPDGVGFYPDMQGGKRGYNTDAARGADTFIPFSTIFSEFDLSYISTSATKRVINVSEGNVVMYYTNATAFSTSEVIVDNLSTGNYCVLVCKGTGTLTIMPNVQTSGWIGGILR